MSYTGELKLDHAPKRIKGSIETTDKQLLNYVKEEELIRCLGPDHYSHLKSTLAKKSDKKVTLKDVKREIATNSFYIKLLAQIRASPIGAEATTKYLNVNILTPRNSLKLLAGK